MSKDNRNEKTRITGADNPSLHGEDSPQEGEGFRGGSKGASGGGENGDPIHASTAILYRNRASNLIYRFEREQGLMFEESLSEFRDWIENVVFVGLRSASKRQMRAALCFYFRETLGSDMAIRDVGVRKGSDGSGSGGSASKERVDPSRLMGIPERGSRRAAVEAAAEIDPDDEGDSSSNKKKRLPNRTSSGRVKSIPRDHYYKLVNALAGRNGFHHHLAGAMLVAGRAFGLRPIEWLNAELRYHSDPEGGATRFTLRVKNAKQSQERTFGPTRTLHTDSNRLQEYEVQAALHVINHFPAYARERILRKPELEHDEVRLLDPTRNALRRTVEQIGWKSQITLYSARHQFAADAKASGVTLFELAAMMGHASIETAQTHYGARRSGWGTPDNEGWASDDHHFRVLPDPEDLAAVVRMNEHRLTGDLAKNMGEKPGWTPDF